MNSAATLADAASARSQAYWLFSRLLLAPPDAALVGEFSAVFSAAAREVGTALAPHAEAFAAAARDLAGKPLPLALGVEFTQLFGAIRKENGPPPVEAIVREGRTLGAAVSAVAIAYSEAGFPDPLPEAGPPDHAAAELRFLALCCHAEFLAWRDGDLEAGGQWLQREQQFLANHAGAWLPGYCDDAQARACLPLYRAGLHLLAAVLRVELEDVAQMLERVEAMTAPAQDRA